MNRQEQIYSKGFNMNNNSNIDYSKVKVGVKTLDDAILNLGALKKLEKNYGNKAMVLQALAQKDMVTLREISEYFYAINGIYKSVY